MITETYHFTSTLFTGIVTIQYNEGGQLVSIDLTGAELKAEQISWFNNSMPKTLSGFNLALKGNKNAKLVKLQVTGVTFEQFWDRYDYKARSSRKKSEQKWNRMSQAQRDKAYNFIGSYERNIPAGLAKKYAETYLNAEQWNN